LLTANDKSVHLSADPVVVGLFGAQGTLR
jgi:hypothetical protein